MPTASESKGYKACRFSRRWKGEITFTTYNIRSFGYKRADSEFYYSYFENLNHDALCITETWNSQRHFESWNCAVSAENLTGKDKPAGVCIILSKRFASLQMDRGSLGTRGCWVRIRGPVCNLLLIGVYLPPQRSKTNDVDIMKQLKALLKSRSENDCVVLMGDFNVRLPRKYKDVVGPFAHRHWSKTMSGRKLEILRIMMMNGLFAVNTYFRSKKRQSMHTWRRSRDHQRGQIDYVMASKRWRSSFTDAKVQWRHSRFKHGEPTDHGLILVKFRWRLGKRKRTSRIYWRGLKPIMTAGDEPVNINRTLTEFDKECQAEWSTDHDITQGDPLMTLNRVTTSVAKQVIPPVALETTAKLRPSAESKAFAEERAEEIKRGVTPQRRKQLHRKMSRFRRKDYKQWHLQSVNKLNECIQQQRWQAAKKWDRRLRGYRERHG